MPSAISAFDAGRQRRNAGPVRLRIGARIEDVSYEIALGFPSVEPTSTFALDAEIKEQAAWFGTRRSRHTELLDRSGATATARDVDGQTVTFAMVIDRFEPALSQLGEPALGFTLGDETGHGSAKLDPPTPGPYVFVDSVDLDEVPSVEVFIDVVNNAAMPGEWEATHWGTHVRRVEDADGRTAWLQEVGPEGH